MKTFKIIDWITWALFMICALLAIGNALYTKNMTLYGGVTGWICAALWAINTRIIILTQKP